MNKMQSQVLEFHHTYGAEIGETVRELPAERVELRIGLIEEEFVKELIPALRSGDLVESVDAAIDILYVTFGLLVEMGVDAEPIFDEVQRSNMSKLGEDGKPIISRGEELDGFPAGKVLKGPNYFKPDIGALLARQIQSGRDILGDFLIARGDFQHEEVYGTLPVSSYIDYLPEDD